MKPLESLTDTEVRILVHDWYGVFARDKQQIPVEDYSIWFILAGRGWGKNRTAAEWIRHRVETGKAKRIALVAPTAADCRDVIVEGESGILAVSPSWNKPVYESSKRRLTWPNGAIATLYSAEEPDRLNGPQHDTAWSDEIGIWSYCRETWDMLQFGLRLGDSKQIVTTTPKVNNLSMIKEIMQKKGTVVTKGTTYENKKNISKAFFETIIKRYEGLRIGRQELNAELLEDIPGALWKRELIDELRKLKTEIKELRRIVIGVDPQGKKDTRDKTIEEGQKRTGIVVCSGDDNGHGYVLEDATINGTPREWGMKAIEMYDKWKADKIVAEVNYGGDMVESVIRGIDPNVSLKLVRASRGKYIRAEPIASLYEQKRIHHVGIFPELEDEMCGFTPESTFSPNRLDAMVWGFTELFERNYPAVLVSQDDNVKEYIRHKSMWD